MRNKKVQYALMILGPLVLIAGAWWYFSGGGSPVADRLTYFDVLTGERFTASRTDKRVQLVPAPNAEGVRSIYPIVKDDEGNWVVLPRYQEHVARTFQGDARLRVDLESYRVLTDR